MPDFFQGEFGLILSENVGSGDKNKPGFTLNWDRAFSGQTISSPQRSASPKWR